MFRKDDIYPVDYILSIIRGLRDDRAISSPSNNERIMLDGDDVGVSSLRLMTFANKGIKCVICGITGEYFVKEKHHKSDPKYHLALYADTDDGMVLMTKDHIEPVSRGGADSLNNTQPMCQMCNTAKGTLFLDAVALKAHLTFYEHETLRVRQNAAMKFIKDVINKKHSVVG